MKKLLLVLVLLAMFAQVRAVDDGEKEKFEWGLKMGMTMASTNFEGRDLPIHKDLKQLLGPTAGFLFEIPICDYFEIRPEINFNTHGNRYVSEIGNLKIVSSEAWGYLEFPVLAKVKYGNEKASGFIHVGPQFGAGLFGEYRIRSNNDGDRDSDRETLHFDEQHLNRFDAGLAFGLGMECNKTGIELEARYYLGLADITDWPGGERPDGVKKTTNRGLNVTVGWKF